MHETQHCNQEVMNEKPISFIIRSEFGVSLAPVLAVLPETEEGLGLAQKATPGSIMRRISEQPAVQTSHLPQPERVVAEDVTLAAKVCFASFSRHVDLLEPLVEPRLAAAM